jgi:hypothetical protein
LVDPKEFGVHRIWDSRLGKLRDVVEGERWMLPRLLVPAHGMELGPLLLPHSCVAFGSLPLWPPRGRRDQRTLPGARPCARQARSRHLFRQCVLDRLRRWQLPEDGRILRGRWR